jgi:hypothetical protein
MFLHFSLPRTLAALSAPPRYFALTIHHPGNFSSAQTGKKVTSVISPRQLLNHDGQPPRQLQPASQQYGVTGRPQREVVQEIGYLC